MTEATQPQEVSVNISLTVNEVNAILRSLGKHPFEEIVQLITKIKQQGEAQLAALEAAAKPAE